MSQKFELFFFVERHKHFALKENHSQNGANNNISVGFQRTQRTFLVNFKKKVSISKLTGCWCYINLEVLIMKVATSALKYFA